ncbi:MAG: hypothetical protein FD143_3093 [Ignavibacteria bacterium]|nr:MAG: hypothetical protein FD143_3093 [Ignavibacteria bacterium]
MLPIKFAGTDVQESRTCIKNKSFSEKGLEEEKELSSRSSGYEVDCEKNNSEGLFFSIQFSVIIVYYLNRFGIF